MHTASVQPRAPDPAAIAGEVAGIVRGYDDLIIRYIAATTAQLHHQALVHALADERARIAAIMNSPDAPGGKRTYTRIAQLLGVSRSKAQQLVERGRELLAPAPAGGTRANGQAADRDHRLPR